MDGQKECGSVAWAYKNEDRKAEAQLKWGMWRATRRAFLSTLAARGRLRKIWAHCSEYFLTKDVVKPEVLGTFSGLVFNWLNQYLFFTEQTQAVVFIPLNEGWSSMKSRLICILTWMSDIRLNAVLSVVPGSLLGSQARGTRGSLAAKALQAEHKVWHLVSNLCRGRKMETLVSKFVCLVDGLLFAAPNICLGILCFFWDRGLAEEGVYDNCCLSTEQHTTSLHQGMR